MKHLLCSRRLTLFLVAIACSQIGSRALAGGWIGGGELFESSMNPWFVQAGRNKAIPIVRYCIEVDEQNFGVPAETLHGHVQNAFSYWIDEFRSSHVPIISSGMSRPR